MAPSLLKYSPFLLLLLVLSAPMRAEENTWYQRQTEWNGYPQYHFTIAGRPAYIVTPKQAAEGKPWIWRARFPNFHAEMDITLLGQGFHVAYVDVAGLFGAPAAMKIGDEFYKSLTTQHGFAEKPALEGVSRGGLFVYNWAARNPDKVACIYCDTPVLDFKSWPGGKGQGLGSPTDWQQCLKVYELTEDQALAWNQNPIDHAKIIAQAKIPILHIVSENDAVVPPAENTSLLQRRLKEFGHPMEIISVPMGTRESNGHHFTHPEPERVVKFIAKHAAPARMSRLNLLKNARRVVFLGDSITYAGHYVSCFEAWLPSQLEHPPLVINVGLPSETVSGLSEEGHAGGQFPRPDLAERLDRVLKVTQPDLVFACYGINCGIYEPLAEERFQAYQRGIETLKQKVEATGAQLILITPPTFDDQQAKKSFSYNGVMDRYAQWLVAQRKQGWQVIDLHTAMAQELQRRREAEPKFTFQPDAVHPNEAGHWFMASQLIQWFGDDKAAAAESPEAMLTRNQLSPELLPLVNQRMTLLRDAYLTAAGHQRPGVRAGLPLDQAAEKVKKLTEQIREVQSAR